MCHKLRIWARDGHNRPPDTPVNVIQPRAPTAPPVGAHSRGMPLPNVPGGHPPGFPRVQSFRLTSTFSGWGYVLVVSARLKPAYSSLCRLEQNLADYMNGYDPCVLSAATHSVEEVMGIRRAQIGDNTAYRAEFTTAFRPVEQFAKWCDNEHRFHRAGDHVAIFALYDDGWRVIDWSLQTNAPVDCLVEK
jgi:hypothetical protein